MSAQNKNNRSAIEADSGGRECYGDYSHDDVGDRLYTLLAHEVECYVF